LERKLMKASTKTIPILGGLALLATAAGVTLGHSAVSEINPVYFSAAPTRFHGDQAPQRPDWTAPQPALSAVSADGLGSGCFGCSARGGEHYAAPAVVTYTDSWRADAERASAPVEAAVIEQVAAPDPERERVVRYASYPITQAEAEPAAAEPEVFAAAEAAAE
jgi:hypothetical protein